MPTPAKKNGVRFTYADYLTWPDDERWEIVDGEAFAMTPAPTLKHQRILVNMCAKFSTFLAGKPCEVFVAPTDVVLDDCNVVQPDLLVVCDRNKLTEANVRGVPDLAVEILSPSTGVRDKREKKELYERFGVREYLIVYPEEEMVERFRLVDGAFQQPDIVNWDETLTLGIFPELELRLCEIFGRGQPE